MAKKIQVNEDGYLTSTVFEKTDEEITNTYHVGTSLDEMCEKFGEDTVFAKALQKITQDVQSVQRTLSRDGKSEDEVQAYLERFVVGSAKTVVPAEDALIAKYKAMTPEKRAEEIAELQRQLAELED